MFEFTEVLPGQVRLKGKNKVKAQFKGKKFSLSISPSNGFSLREGDKVYLQVDFKNGAFRLNKSFLGNKIGSNKSKTRLLYTMDWNHPIPNKMKKGVNVLDGKVVENHLGIKTLQLTPVKHYCKE